MRYSPAFLRGFFFILYTYYTYTYPCSRPFFFLYPLIFAKQAAFMPPCLGLAHCPGTLLASLPSGGWGVYTWELHLGAYLHFPRVQVFPLREQHSREGEEQVVVLKGFLFCWRGGGFSWGGEMGNGWWWCAGGGGGVGGGGVVVY